MHFSIPARRLMTIAIFGSVMFVSCKDNRKAFREELQEKCISDGDKQFTDGRARKYFHEYCECSAAKISEKVSKAEMDKLKEKGEDAVRAKMEPLLQPCIEEARRKMEQIKP